jgi:hypothetical protein
MPLELQIFVGNSLLLHINVRGNYITVINSLFLQKLKERIIFQVEVLLKKMTEKMPHYIPNYKTAAWLEKWGWSP